MAKLETYSKKWLVIKLFNIKETILRNYIHEGRTSSRHVGHLFENMSSEFPIEPTRTTWERKDEKDEFLELNFKFSNREDLKDFVASIQELEDRMQLFCRLNITKNDAKITCELPPSKVVNERLKDFLNAAKSLEESINERI